MRLQHQIASFFALSLALLVAWPAQAADCPCTFEQLLCGSDAVAEVEVFLATETTEDRTVIRQTIWNGTKHPIRPWPGVQYIPAEVPTKAFLQQSLSIERKERRRTRSKEPLRDWNKRFLRALRQGSYRKIVFLQYFSGLWAGGAAVLQGVEWLDHPRHGEWWADLQPALQERIRLATQGKKPDYCADLKKPTRFPDYYVKYSVRDGN